jgi:hypothetical protein
VDPETGGAPSYKRIIQDCEKCIRSLETIRQAGGKIVEGFDRSDHRRHKQGSKLGGFQPKKPQGPAKWVHDDARRTQCIIWCQSVDQVDRHLNQINTPTRKLTGQTMETCDTGSTDVASSSNESRHNNKPTHKTHISPLTIEYFGDMEVEKETKKEKNNNCAMSDSEDDIVNKEANYYAVLDKEVMGGLLGLTSLVIKYFENVCS